METSSHLETNNENSIKLLSLCSKPTGHPCFVMLELNSSDFLLDSFLLGCASPGH